jgi:hypothetical protein
VEHGQPKQHRSPEAGSESFKFCRTYVRPGGPARQLWVVVVVEQVKGRQGGRKGGGVVQEHSYLMMRLTRLFSISYTPSCKTSFLRRRTGPSSGSIHGHPLVARSGSVAARKMAPATRSTGVLGMPAERALDFQSIILVSEHKRQLLTIIMILRKCQ